ncbi:putative coiled-coil domain-containing protein [Apostichopus japonicus]|uniref:Putative coiled-coil domain-containing protein n=1 Tax=Stichopus japonicus TaxID=307972 RepID=A0A2G8L9B1_STIJA|nr:putative coiled-coil domain-containing protein [Apostichopus japonicus]
MSSSSGLPDLLDEMQSTTGWPLKQTKRTSEARNGKWVLALMRRNLAFLCDIVTVNRKYRIPCVAKVIMEQSQDSSLHQQFQALQEQQKKKLMKRKQKQEDKIKEQNTKNEEVNGLGVPDNMDLKLSQPIPQDSIFNEELNNHLQEQLRELKDETGRLYKLLSERDHEVRKLKKKRDEERQAFSGMGGGMATDAAATKIVELSKKNRELTAELESEKTKLKQLLLKLREAEKLNSSKATLSSRSPRSTREELRDPIEIQADKTAAELKTTQEKLNQATAKLGEFRTQVATLKQDLKLAHKALSNEVGEGVNISALLTAVTVTGGEELSRF